MSHDEHPLPPEEIDRLRALASLENLERRIATEHERTIRAILWRALKHGALRLAAHPTILPTTALLALGAWFISQTTFYVDGRLASFLFDDASITLRYARNFANGFGITWNPGDLPIEGISDLGYMLVMALVHAVGVPEPLAPLAVSCIGLGILVALVHVVAALAERLEAGAGRIAAWLVALSYPVFYWTVRGFEVGACALVITSAALLVLSEEIAAHGDGHDHFGDGFAEWDRRLQRNHRRYLGTTALIAAGVLLRDDMVVPLTVIVAFSSYRKGLLAALLTAAALKTGFRLAYFGEWLPLTAYLKLGGVPLGIRLARGLGTLAQALWQGLWLPLLGCVAYGRSRLPLTAVLATTAYSVWVGGDAWEEIGFANRFIAPVIPLAMVGLSAALASILRSTTWLPGIKTAVGILAATLLVWWQLDFERFQSYRPTTWSLAFALIGGVAVTLIVAYASTDRMRGWVAVATLIITSGAPWLKHAREGSSEFFSDRFHVVHGLALETATASTATIALIQAGNEGYYCHRRLIDQLGKSESHIAHEALGAGRWKPGHSKIDPGYSIGRLQPDVVDEVYLRTNDMSPMDAWGYAPANVNLWVRKDSKLVDGRQVMQLAQWDAAQWTAAAAVCVEGSP